MQHLEQPPFLVPASQLKQIRMLNVFEPCTLQIGDRNFYVLKEADVVMSKAEWKRLEKEQLAKGKPGKTRKVGRSRMSSGSTRGTALFWRTYLPIMGYRPSVVDPK